MRPGRGTQAANEGNRLGILPDLRSSKLEGQANFLNPGLRLLNAGVSAKVTPKLFLDFNANFLRFDQTEVLEQFVFQDNVDPFIGVDLSAGVGHRPLVSRRWLETGPWRLVHAPNDTSVVIFHDLDADPATALTQARPGHAQIGNTEESGFLYIPFCYYHDLGGLYDPATGALTSVVHGREPTPRELLEWAAIRANQRLGPERPIARVRFVFPEEARARALLPLLWRYGHECWAIIDGAEVRLDTDEVPPGPPRARPRR